MVSYCYGLLHPERHLLCAQILGMRYIVGALTRLQWNCFFAVMISSCIHNMFLIAFLFLCLLFQVMVSS